MSAAPRTLDVSATCRRARSARRTLTFWGTLGHRRSSKARCSRLAIAAYFYLVSRSPAWPPHGVRAARSALGNDQHARAAGEPDSERAGDDEPASASICAPRADLAGRVSRVRASASTSSASTNSRT